MNIQVGKSSGIALLMAAALLAALFAMGVFAPAGVEAGVKGTPKPTATLSDSIPGTEDVTLTVTFEINDDIDDAPGGATSDVSDDVVINVPAAIAVIAANFDADNISVKQGGVDVGSVSVTDAQEITIAEPTEASGNGVVREDVPITVEIRQLDLAAAPAQGTIYLGQTGTVSDSAGEQSAALAIHPSVTAASFTLSSYDAYKEAVATPPSPAQGDNVTMTITFRTNQASDVATTNNDVVIVLPEDYDVDTDGVAYTINGTCDDRLTACTESDDTAEGADTGGIVKVSGVDAALTAVAVGGNSVAEQASGDPTLPQFDGDIITIGVFDKDTDVTVTITRLRNPGESKPVMVGFKQSTFPTIVVAAAGPPAVERDPKYHRTDTKYITKVGEEDVTGMISVDELVPGTAVDMTLSFTAIQEVMNADSNIKVTLNGVSGLMDADIMVQAMDANGMYVDAGMAMTPSGNMFYIGKAATGGTNIMKGQGVKVTISGLTLGMAGDTLSAVVKQGEYEAGMVGQEGNEFAGPTVPGGSIIGPAPVAPAPRVDNGVDLSTENAGAAVRIDIDADADAVIAGGEDIVVELPKFGLPDSISTSEVLIDSNGYIGNPSDVTVSGSKITIEVPTREGGTASSERTNIPVGDYSIKLKQGAGITNPAGAGDQTVKITDKDATAEEYDVTIVHVVSLSEDSVTRGDDLTLTIKGYANGTASVSINGDEVGQTEVADNVGEFAIDTTDSAVKAGQDNVVTVVDSEGENGGREATDSFTIKAKVAVDPDSTTPSKDVEITLSDWPANQRISSVSIGGIRATVPSGTATDSDGEATFDVEVPRTAKTGTQTLSVTGGSTTATTTIGINVLELTVSPSDAVPGSQVTISGSGFARNTDVPENGLMIGGNAVDPGDDATSTSSGNISVTVMLPLDIGSGTKKVELEIAGRDGEGELTVPKPSVELDPAESVPGSTITVSGTAFAANQRVEISYSGAIEEIGRADGEGNVSVRLTIPSGAGVGTTNKVEVKVRPSDPDEYPDLDVSASADHKTPGPEIMVPDAAQVGTLMTISGTNFDVFSALTVTIGGRVATPSPAPESDKNGAFEFSARVPRLSSGSHTVTIRDNRNNSATESFNVVTTAVVYTPEEVFGDLIDAGVLASVWRYSIDETGSDWDSYDPQFADEEGINDLETVTSGDIVWIRVTENATFQGATLYAGWNLVTLE